jgi:hypothetical protein
MVLPIKLWQTGWAIEQQRQKEMAYNYRRENFTIISYDQKVGDKVILKKPGTGKHLIKIEAPRKVTTVYTNGTLRIQKGKVNERVNIRRLFPYFEHADH